jgi:TRAP-type C4-dicarboxylate transport system substrate-binding protein
MKKVMYFLITGALMAVSLFGNNTAIAAKPLKLHIASWNVPGDPTTKVLEAIAADLEAASGGSVTAEISFKALGKPSDYYDAVANGLCDMAYVALTFIPGRFLQSEMLMLPIAYPDNNVRGRANYEMWQRGYYDKQFADVKIVALGNTVDFLFMWANEPVTNLNDLKGKKLSTSNRVHSDMMKAVGAVPVNMPVTELYMSLETKVIDGAFQGWPFIPVFKGQEVVRYATLPSRSGAPCIIAMNKKSYNKLPQEAKVVIDKNVEKYSKMQAQGFQKFDELGRKIFLDSGGKIVTLSAADSKKMDMLYKPIFDEWVKVAKERGLPAEKALNDLYAILEELGVNDPFVR